MAENILEREQGRGTFVRSHTRDYMLNVFFQLVDAEGRKELPQIELLSFARWRADAGTAQRLRLAPGSPVLRLRNLLTLDGQPTVYDDVRLPAARFAGLTARELSERDITLYGLLQQRFGITVVRIVEHLEAVAATRDIARLLGVPAGHPLLKIVRTAYSHGGEPTDTRLRWVRTGARRYESAKAAAAIGAATPYGKNGPSPHCAGTSSIAYPLLSGLKRHSAAVVRAQTSVTSILLRCNAQRLCRSSITE